MNEAQEMTARLQLLDESERMPVDIEVFLDGDAVNTPAPWVARVRLPGAEYEIQAPSFEAAWKAARQAASPATIPGSHSIFGTRSAPAVMVAPEKDEVKDAGPDTTPSAIWTPGESDAPVGIGGGGDYEIPAGGVLRLLPDPRDEDEPEGAAVIAKELQLGDFTITDEAALAAGTRIVRRLYRDGYALAIRP